MGPVDRARAASAASLLQSATALARDAGVTRLADITRLDRIGLPVWQAIRPMSRALSVHQGKGATTADAQVGALLEAAESHFAEIIEADGPTASLGALGDASRPATLRDYTRDGREPPSPRDKIEWMAGTTHDGVAALIPFDCVSLDFTRPDDSPFERSSAGLATGSTTEEAQRTALHELIERDALRAFLGLDMVERLELEVRPSSIPYDWYGALETRIEQAGVALRVFHLPTVTGSPAFAASLRDRGKDARPYRAIVGHAAHQDPETALFKAVSEAVQSRLTFISAAREDCLPSLYDDPRLAMSYALASPPNPAARPCNHNEICEGPAGADAIVETLARTGFDQVIHVPIRKERGFVIQRSFVPGLGSMSRARR
ncbi:MAG: hypothetical protein HKO13_06990 [Sphingomonas sp.]|nr:hypothetical protein [Sphingomonas sp.]RZV50957.1 MAG: hypothetical protein EX258_04550 [Sphingomonadaceae bacterium]